MDHMGLGFRPLERMTQKRDKRVLFAAMLVTVPCPAIFLFCNGLLSVSALGLGLVSFTAIAFRDPVALVFAIAAVLYGAVYGLSLYWLAGLLSRRLASFRVLGLARQGAPSRRSSDSYDSSGLLLRLHGRRFLALVQLVRAARWVVRCHRNMRGLPPVRSRFRLENQLGRGGTRLSGPSPSRTTRGFRNFTPPPLQKHMTGACRDHYTYFAANHDCRRRGRRLLGGRKSPRAICRPHGAHDRRSGQAGRGAAPVAG
jgi:hypothetical protein